MARIAGIDLPMQKRVVIALTYIYGIGRKTALNITTQAGIDLATRTKDLTEDQTRKIRELIFKKYNSKATTTARKILSNAGKKNMVDVSSTQAFGNHPAPAAQ